MRRCVGLGFLLNENVNRKMMDRNRKRVRQRAGAIFLSVVGVFVASGVWAQSTVDTVQTYDIGEVVVTGTRNETDVRHLSQTVSVVGRTKIENALQASLLPVLSEQIPGLFVTSRGVMGYGVSGGAAGNLSLRGLSGGSGRLMVLIDGHPQYAGIFGHPISDAYQSFLADVSRCCGVRLRPLRIERHGWCGEYRHTQDAAGWRENESAYGIRVVQYVGDGVDQPDP